jgi:hypothetical protein
MASCICWSNDFSPSATDWDFYKYLRLTVRNLSLRRTSLTCDSGSIVVCFLIASLRCCRKVRGFSSEPFCKAKLLFHIDTWYSGEQVSEPFWASVSSLEEWGIWSRLSYFLPVWDGWSDINATYLPYHFFKQWWGIEPRALYMLGRHSPIELCPYPQIFFPLSFGCSGAWTQDFMPAKRHSTVWTILSAPSGVDLSKGLPVPFR